MESDIIRPELLALTPETYLKGIA